jgi:hypothetical protein
MMNIFSGYDLLFYSYDSRHDSALASATILFDFLDPFLGDPAHRINDQLDSTRPWNFRHSEIYIIAHSLGAPITRKMLLTALLRKSTWLPKVNLIFFAPATAGVRAEEILRLVFGWFFHVYRYNCPVVDDLRIGSTFLRILHSETDKAVLSDDGEVFRASGTFFGEHEKVVDLPIRLSQVRGR